MKKLNIGCGNDILEGWVNHDLVALPGVDVVHDLTKFPWPFEEDEFDEVVLIHVLEHLPDTVRTVEELHRITTAGAKVTIRVPFWNSPDMMTDPTHKAFFNERSFEYFDPSYSLCQRRSYYSTARFEIAKKYYFAKLRRYRKVSSAWQQKILETLSHYLCGIIWVIEYDLRTIK